MFSPIKTYTMSNIQFAIIADDNTGATDAAGMLTEKVVHTCLINDFSAVKDTSFKKVKQIGASVEAGKNILIYSPYKTGQRLMKL